MAAASQYYGPLVESSPTPPRPEKEQLRILLIEDAQSITDYFCGSLRSAGYALYPATTGGEALQRFQAARPDLILLELGLPDMDGKQVLRLLRKVTMTPIIVLSAHQEEEEKIACLDTGADDYITKPFTTGELLARLRAALRRAFGIPRNEVFSAGDLRVEDSLHLLRVTMSNLRRKLGPAAAGFRAIATEPGVGYRLRPSDCQQSFHVT
jgi:two-component system KDP operon response regulator KdpE